MLRKMTCSYQIKIHIVVTCDKLKKKLYNILYNIFFRYAPIKYIHIADLLYPQKEGITPMQYVILSRVLDTRMWKMNATPVWHIKLSDMTDEDCQNRFNYQYKKFLSRLQLNGGNPGKFVLPIRTVPYWGVADGSHRLGWWLNEITNGFIPVKIINSLFKQVFPANGTAYWRDFGLTEDDLYILQGCHRELWKCIRHKLLACFFECEKFIKAKPFIVNTIQSISEDVEIKELKRTGRIVTVVWFSLVSQDYYYDNNILKSRVIDELRFRIDEYVDSYDYVVAASVTESIKIEDKLFGENANYKK